MGKYLGVGNAGFASMIKGIYVDKMETALLERPESLPASAGRGALESRLPQKCYAHIMIKVVIRGNCLKAWT